MAVSLAGTSLTKRAQKPPVALLKVSCDPTREPHVDYNAAVSKQGIAEVCQDATLMQFHGGSGEWAWSTMDGLNADVATLALAGDSGALVKREEIKP